MIDGLPNYLFWGLGRCFLAGSSAPEGGQVVGAGNMSQVAALKDIFEIAVRCRGPKGRSVFIGMRSRLLLVQVIYVQRAL